MSASKKSIKKKATKKKAATKKTTKKAPKKGRNVEELTAFALGSANTQYPDTYAPEVLEAFDNKNPGSDAWTTFVCTEFTSLCPKTAQPDFARIYINYIADKKMVESKSLKLYLFSFRNHGDFHEDCVQKICDDLTKLMKPKFIEVIGEFTPRGGICIYPYASNSNNKKIYKEIRAKRFSEYAPGKYTMDLSKIY
ncbi:MULTISPECIES: preQ(1) synthase [unclassified Halobacteriovorax]|uniref:preQ(1) synthase n=1 Tax=unclassified Halobacteriovorax TaxID=2639665 RepID=UPI002FEF0F14